MPSLDDFPGGQREQEAIRYLLQLNPRSLPRSVSGLISESFDRRYATTSELITGGRLYSSVVMLLAGETLTSASLNVVTPGSGQTLARVGLWEAPGGTLLASSASDTTLGTGTGFKQATFTSPYTVTGNPDQARPLWVGALFVGGTLPTLATSEAAGFSLAGAFGSGIVLAGRTDSQADLPATLVPTGHGIQLWFGLS